MLTTDLLNEALELIEEAKKNSAAFMELYPANLRATGETAAEYSLYEFELSEEYYLVIDFIEFSFEDFSIVSRAHEAHIVHNAEEDLE